MSCDCYGSVALLHGAWVGPQYVIVVFPDHTRFLIKLQYVVLTKRGLYVKTIFPYFLIFDFSLTVKVAPHECLIRTGQQ